MGPYVAHGAVPAGVLDAIENLAILGLINGWSDFLVWPAIAGVMAIPKFLLVLVAMVYVIMGVVTAIAQTTIRS